MDFFDLSIKDVSVVLLDGFPEIAQKFGLFDALLINAVHPVILLIADVGLQKKSFHFILFYFDILWLTDDN